ncbi:MAG: PD40 domain-containing protein [Candidatus Aminicenantes bacterium]|nr:PD40 domain-containing protein [Candidatus Aminicenantes bacterium]
MAAKAQLQIGICYEKLGLKQAQEAFQEVIDKYPEQTEAVKAAKAKLAILLRAQSVVEKGDKEFKMTKIPTDPEKTAYAFISPDGKKLAFVGTDGDIWLRDIARGKDLRLTKTSIFDYWCFWSPNSEKIAYLDVLNGLHVVSVKGGTPKTLIKADSEFIKSGKYAWPVSWTADSGMIICIVSDRGLCALPISGKEWKDLIKYSDLEQVEKDSPMVLSPDGRLIAYESKKFGKADIFIVPVSGGKPIQITNHPAPDIWPVWSYDGKWLAFFSERSGNNDIWAIKIGPDGNPESDPFQVYQGMPRRNNFFGWTKDGKIGISKTPVVSNIFVASADASKEIQLTTVLSSDWRPRWSPDGTQITYISEQGQKRDLWIIPADGGEPRILTANFSNRPSVQYITSPTWLPDGKSIAFTVFVGEDKGMWVIPAQGGTPKKVKFNYNGSIESMDWSPDGSKIAFDYIGGKEGNFIPGSRYFGKDIYVVPVEGGEPVKITKIDKKGLYFYSPRWSPDGKRIAFRSLDWFEYNEGKDPEQIWVVNVQGGEPKTITKKIKGTIRGISWSIDGEYVLFSKLEKDKPYLYVVSSKGGEIRKLNIQGDTPDYSPDGSKIAYVKRLKTINEFWIVENFLPEEK